MQINKCNEIISNSAVNVEDAAYILWCSVTCWSPLLFSIKLVNRLYS